MMYEEYANVLMKLRGSVFEFKFYIVLLSMENSALNMQLRVKRCMKNPRTIKKTLACLSTTIFFRSDQKRQSSEKIKDEFNLKN